MTFRWAIVGTGGVAGKFALGLKSVPGAQAALIASRSPERAKAFAAQLGIPAFAGSYEEAAAAKVDAVYIATPPSEHRAHALLFIAAGKPVLIEKPFAANASDAEAIVAAARSAGVFCMEGMWTRFLPAMRRARELVAAGAVGEPRHLSASFATANPFDAQNSFFRPELGGGALNHRGVYPISLAMDLLGPAQVVSAVLSHAPTGVDDEVTALLRHPGGSVSAIYAGARTNADNGLALLGTEGTLRFAGPIYRPFGLEIAPVRPHRRDDGQWSRAAILREKPFAQSLARRLEWVRGGRRRVLSLSCTGNGYGHEALAVMEALARGDLEHPTMPLDSSVAIAQTIDAIRQIGGGPQRPPG